MDEIICLKEETYATLDRSEIDFGGLRVKVTENYIEGFGCNLELVEEDKGKFCSYVYGRYTYELARHLVSMMEEELGWHFHLDEPRDYMKNGIEVKFEDLEEGKDYIDLSKNPIAYLFESADRIINSDEIGVDDLLADSMAIKDGLKGLEKIISKIKAERNWEQDAKQLYTALSRLYSQGDDEAHDMAFNVLSEVSVDFRNEYTAHAWTQEN